MLEDLRVQPGDIHGGEHADGADGHGVKEETVFINVFEEREVAAAVGPFRIERKHAAAQVFEFPRADEDQPGEFGEDGGARAEHGIAAGTVVAVAVDAEVGVAGAVDDDDEGEEGAGAHDGAVDQHVDDDLGGEDAVFGAVGRPTHDVVAGFFAAQTEGREGGGEHVDPEDLERGQGEDGEAGFVLEPEADDEEDDFGDVGGEEVQDELLDVVEHAPAFFDRVDDAGEIVVG